MAKKAYVNDGNDWVELASSSTDLSGYLLESSASTTYATKTELNNIDLSSASAAAVAAIVDSAPSTLNTLNELAAALGDDANYASTITTALGNKLDISTASSTYLTQVNASTTYLTKASASTTYATVDISLAAATQKAVNVVEPVSRYRATSGTKINGGVFFMTFFTAPKNQTISTLSAFVTTTVSSGDQTLSRMGLYTMNETTATLVASTANSTTFGTVSGLNTRSLTTSYDLVAGERYGIGLINTGSATPALLFTSVNTAVAVLAPRMNATLTGQTDLPSTVTSFGSPSNVYYFRAE